jgi:hypothetical protein
MRSKPGFKSAYQLAEEQRHREAREAIEIARLCTAVNQPQLACDFICQGKSLAEVQAILGTSSNKSQSGSSVIDGLIRHARLMGNRQTEALLDSAFEKARTSWARP